MASISVLLAKADALTIKLKIKIKCSECHTENNGLHKHNIQNWTFLLESGIEFSSTQQLPTNYKNIKNSAR